MPPEFWIEVEESGQRQRVPLTGSEITIGRGEENTIVLQDKRSSRHHCRVRATAQGLLLEDLNSRNGTVFNGTTVSECIVKPGDDFRIGKALLMVGEGPIEGQAQGLRPETEIGLSDFEDEISRPQVAPRMNVQVVVDDSSDSVPGSIDGHESEVTAKKKFDERCLTDACLFLETMNEAPERVAVARFPFVLGRKSSAGLVVSDPRVSGAHARLEPEGAHYVVEDLNSRNGTFLNDRLIKRAVLKPGSILRVGDTRFRVHCPRPPKAVAVNAVADAGSAEAGGAWATDEYLGRVSGEVFSGQGGKEQRISGITAGIIVLVIFYFSIDVGRRLLVSQPVDPVSKENLISTNWSFESPVVENSVFGWAASEEMPANLSVRLEDAQFPGRQALYLEPNGASRGLSIAQYIAPIGVRGGAPYRVRGFTLNRGPFATGFLIEWLRDDRRGPVTVAQSYTVSSRAPDEALSVDQVVVAPPVANLARVSCFLVGGRGVGVFDRVSFSEIRDDGGEGREASADDTSATKSDGGARTYHFGEESSRATLQLRRDGVFAVSRARQTHLPAIWIGLAPGNDPFGFGPRLAPVRIVREHPNELELITEVPDVASGRWITVEGSLFVTEREVAFTWRHSSARLGQHLCLFIATKAPRLTVRFPPRQRQHLLSDPHLGAGSTQEVVFGEGKAAVTVWFGHSVDLEVIKHPVDGKPVLMLQNSGDGEFSMRFSDFSRLQRAATRQVVEEAEELYRAGHVGEAVNLLEEVESLPSVGPVERELAIARAKLWLREASDLVKILEDEVADLRSTPNEVLYRLIISRAEEVGSRYVGLTIESRCQALVSRAEKIWEDHQLATQERRAERIFEWGRNLYQSEKRATGRHLLRQLDPESIWGRRARPFL